MKNRLNVLLCLGVIALLALPASAQDWKGRGRAQGLVVDEAGDPIEGAQIRLYTGFGDNKEGPEPFLTNKKGIWSHLGLRLGPWTVEISKEGYDTSTGSFQVQTQRNDRLRTTLYESVVEEIIDEAAVAAKNSLEEGNGLLAAGDYAGARTAYRAAIDGLDAAYHGMILMEIARSYSLEGDTDGAIGALKEVLVAEPDNEAAIKLVSDLLVAEGRMEEAQPYIALLPEDAKLDPNALANIGIDHYNSNEFDQAIAQFDLILAEQDDYSMGYYYRGLSYLATGKTAEAAADLARFIELEPDHENAAEAQEMLNYLNSQE